jgi:hypothetical protein
MAAVAGAVPGGSSASGPRWSFAGHYCLPGARAREDAAP